MVLTDSNCLDYSSQFCSKENWCIFCLRKCKNEDFNQSEELEDSSHQKRLLKVLLRHIGYNTNALEFRESCEECSLLLGEFYIFYNEFKYLQMNMNWKLEMLLGRMKFANKVPLRIKTLRKSLTKDDDGKFQNLQHFRRMLVKLGSAKLKSTYPRVHLTPCDTDLHRRSRSTESCDLSDLKENGASNTFASHSSSKTFELQSGKEEITSLIPDVIIKEEPPENCAFDYGDDYHSETIPPTRLQGDTVAWTDSEDDGDGNVYFSMSNQIQPEHPSPQDTYTSGGSDWENSVGDAAVHIKQEAEEIQENMEIDEDQPETECEGKAKTVFNIKIKRLTSNTPSKSTPKNPAKRKKKRKSKAILERLAKLEEFNSQLNQPNPNPPTLRELAYAKVLHHKYHCNIPPCTNTTTTLWNVEDFKCHLRHHGYFKCDYCNHIVTYAPDLVQHEIEEHTYSQFKLSWKEKKLRQCPRCDYTALKNHSLKNHFLKSHLNLTPDRITCTICKQWFGDIMILTLPYKLMNHFATHHTHEEHCTNVCDVGNCRAFFKTEGQLLNHKVYLHKYTPAWQSQSQSQESLSFGGDFTGNDSKNELCTAYLTDGIPELGIKQEPDSP